MAVGPPSSAEGSGAVAGGRTHVTASGESADPSSEMLEATMTAAASFEAFDACNPPGGRALTAQEKQALDQYVEEGRWPERRAEAVDRISSLIREGRTSLVMTDLRLTRLPDLVTTLRLNTLDVSGNQLHELAVPAKCSFFYVSGNKLSSMPVLPEDTRMVFASDNPIREFRGPLPSTLHHVQAANNALDTIPPLPPSVTYFNIAGNTGRLAQADVDARMRGTRGAAVA
ncbi:hypothetical protein AKI39_00420 [Bordetella sp. H567]|nr:hypothetical protein AKI39_00420 [Bordetella sp. H567]